MIRKVLINMAWVIAVVGVIYAFVWSTSAIPVIQEVGGAEIYEDINATLQGIVDNSDGVIAEMSSEHTGSYYQVDVFIFDTAWTGFSVSDKESFATKTGTEVQDALPDSTIVSFYEMESGILVADGDVFGEYTVID
ncbi:hypothetical protein [Paenisporosarcina indica]|uniref:hypothetical protein n=1 Tax=Paenisporosarcina indica TaxID=650093 RepID=UPI00094F666E|nr:hypothetical protein [Paenisporosarcina indica]